MKTLGERDSGTANLAAAVAAYRAALDMARQAKAEYYITMFPDNLARAENLLRQRQQ